MGKYPNVENIKADGFNKKIHADIGRIFGLQHPVCDQQQNHKKISTIHHQ